MTKELDPDRFNTAAVKAACTEMQSFLEEQFELQGGVHHSTLFNKLIDVTKELSREEAIHVTFVICDNVFHDCEPEKEEEQSAKEPEQSTNVILAMQAFR